MIGKGPPLKVGLLHYSCPPVVGGVEEVLRQQAIWLDRFGHQVQVIAGIGGPSPNGLDVTLAPLLSSRNSRIKQADTLSKQGVHEPVQELAEEIRRYLTDWARGLDVILAHNVLHMPFNLPLTLALHEMASRDDSPALVSWAHDSPYLNDSVPDYLAAPPWDILRRRHPKMHYVTISNARLGLFRERMGDFSWRVVNNGVDPVDFFHLGADVVKLMKELNLATRDLVMVMPARITPRKNLELAIHLVHAIKGMGKNVLFMLTGAYDPHDSRAPSYYRRLKYWIDKLELGDNIAILAEYAFADGSELVLDLDLIRSLYLISDIMLMTSKDEGFCLPLLEAGLIKLPIACPNIPPFTEVGEDLCFFPLGDPPKATAKRILDYLEGANTHAMFRKAMHKYAWEMICEKQLIPFLREIAG